VAWEITVKNRSTFNQILSTTNQAWAGTRLNPATNTTSMIASPVACFPYTVYPSPFRTLFHRPCKYSSSFYSVPHTTTFCTAASSLKWSPHTKSFTGQTAKNRGCKVKITETEWRTVCSVSRFTLALTCRLQEIHKSRSSSWKMKSCLSTITQTVT
jgi:hypothetical protein